MAPDEVEAGGADLCYHGDPSLLQTHQESLGQVEHAEKIDKGQVYQDVIVCLTGSFFIFTNPDEDRFCETESDGDDDKDEGVDQACPIEVDTAQTQLFGSKGLRNQSFNCSIRADNDEEC